MERIISQNLETNNRKLLELLGASRLAENLRENCDLSDLTFNTLLDNIADCIYTDVSNVNLPSTDNGITLLHITMRSINNEKNFDKFEEFLKALPCLPDIVCVSETHDIRKVIKVFQVLGLLKTISVFVKLGNQMIMFVKLTNLTTTITELRREFTSRI